MTSALNREPVIVLRASGQSRDATKTPTTALSFLLKRVTGRPRLDTVVTYAGIRSAIIKAKQRVSCLF